MAKVKPMVIDIHAHPFFMEQVCDTDEKLERARNITGLYKTNKISLLQMENKLSCAEIDKVALHPLDLASVMGFELVSNEEMKRIAELRPDRFIGFASVDPGDPGAAEKLEYAFKGLKLSGLKLHPSRQRFFPDDPKMEPLYRICEKYNKPVMFHSGMSVQPGTLGKYSHPLHFEEVALNHPKLRFCLAHFGWPWVQDVCMLLLKYPNVFTDTALIYFGSAYEMYKQLMTVCMGEKWVDRGLRHQVMYGSDDPGLEQIRMCNALRNMNFSESTTELILGENARRFLEGGEPEW